MNGEFDYNTAPVEALFDEGMKLYGLITYYEAPGGCDYYNNIDFTGLQGIGGYDSALPSEEERRKHQANLAQLRMVGVALQARPSLDEDVERYVRQKADEYVRGLGDDAAIKAGQIRGLREYRHVYIPVSEGPEGADHLGVPLPGTYHLVDAEFDYVAIRREAEERFVNHVNGLKPKLERMIERTAMELNKG